MSLCVQYQSYDTLGNRFFHINKIYKSCGFELLNRTVGQQIFQAVDTIQHTQPIGTTKSKTADVKVG